MKSLWLSKWLSVAATSDEVCRLYFVTSGYETRSRYWCEKVFASISPSPANLYHVFGFKEFDNEPSRLENDNFYRGQGLSIQTISSTDNEAFVHVVQDCVNEILLDNPTKQLEIHIDYSSMPRAWYCRLIPLLSPALREGDAIFYWYSSPQYAKAPFPTAGVSDFKVFSGRPTLGSGYRSHLFGLGFDRIRSHAIWSVIDPSNLICYYADPSTNPDYVARVKKDNRDVLNAAQQHFTVPLFDFVYSYSKIMSAALGLRRYGDVILVPDGPKPLILASSLIPDTAGETGIVCFHVGGRRGSNYVPADVNAIGDPFGFSCSISA